MLQSTDDKLFWLWAMLSIPTLASSYVPVLGLASRHGKTLSMNDHQWTVPKRWFTHFYVVGVLVSVLVMMNRQYSLLSFLFCFQCSRRLIESVLLFPGKKESRMSLLAYLVGIVFYPLVRLSILVGGSELDYYACFLFVVSSCIQFWSHSILHSMKGYRIPSDGPFRYTLFPHYLAEVGIYIAFAVLGGKALWGCAGFVSVGLLVNARNQRLWYSNVVGKVH